MNYTHTTFKTFGVDDSNRFATAACKEVATHPGETYDLLWLHGPSGCGKTHLCGAVCHHLGSYAGKAVCIVNTEEAVESLLQFFDGNTSAWKQLEACDVLVLQSVDYLLGKSATQEKLADMIREKCARHQTVLLSSEHLPKTFAAMHDLICTGCERYLFVEITMPGVALRRQIAWYSFEKDPFPVTGTAFEYLTEKIPTVPQLQGALNAARLWSQTNDKKVTLRWAKHYVKTI